MMIYIFRPRMAFRVMVFLVIEGITALAAAAVCRASRVLLTAPRSLVAMDWAAIPAVLVIGWILFKLTGRLFKSSADEDDSSFFSAFGAKAWRGFFAIATGLVFGACIGLNPKFDWQSHPQSYWQANGSAPQMLPQPSQTSGKPQSPGRIYMGPSVPDTSKPAAPSHS